MKHTYIMELSVMALKKLIKDLNKIKVVVGDEVSVTGDSDISDTLVIKVIEK